jgi:hypothetical protein
MDSRLRENDRGITETLRVIPVKRGIYVDAAGKLKFKNILLLINRNGAYF